MTRYFVNRKSDLTHIMEKYTENGYAAYRTRLECNCSTQNRRNGLIVIDSKTLLLTAKVIRCRGCVNRKEGGQL